jgi:hypothetical protein
LQQYGVQRRLSTVLAKHSKSFSLVDAISVGVDRMQRNLAHDLKEFPEASPWSRQ